jgi:hypothetical protein
VPLAAMFEGEIDSLVQLRHHLVHKHNQLTAKEDADQFGSTRLQPDQAAEATARLESFKPLGSPFFDSPENSVATDRSDSA